MGIICCSKAFIMIWRIRLFLSSCCLLLQLVITSWRKKAVPCISVFQTLSILSYMAICKLESIMNLLNSCCQQAKCGRLTRPIHAIIYATLHMLHTLWYTCVVTLGYVLCWVMWFVYDVYVHDNALWKIMFVHTFICP